MKALLLYTPKDAEKNAEYIKNFLNAAKKRGIDMTLATDMKYTVCNIDFVINRSRDAAPAEYFEKHGVKVFNNSCVTDICNDKYKTWQSLKNTVPMLTTYKAEEYTPSQFPVIVKPRLGHGGKNISLAHSETEYAAAKELAESYSDTDMAGRKIYGGAIVQRSLSSSADMRVYVLGKKIIAAVMRKPAGDFRANFSLGGKVSLVEPEADVLNIVGRLTEIFDFGLAGIDFLFDNGKPVLNEIEDAVGARMLYSLMDIDLPGIYLDHILSVL